MNAQPQIVVPQITIKPLTPAQLQHARQIFTAGRLIARKKAPYFQSILLKLIPRETKPTPDFFTVAVTSKLIMPVCMEYIFNLTPQMCAADWIHESLHVFNRHNERCGSRDRKLWNWAGDCTIYTIVRDMGLPQMAASIQPSMFKFPENLTAEAYYELFLKQQKQQQQGNAGQGQGQSQSGKPQRSKQGQGQGQSQQPETGHAQPGRGHCGSCAGHAVAGEPEFGANDPEARSQADIDVAIREVALAIKAASKTRGSVPAGLALLAEETLEPAKVPWRSKLNRAVRGAVQWVTGAVHHRYDAPSVRQACLGYGPGRPVLPRLRAPRPVVAFPLDTSASMGRGEGSPLVLGVNEAYGVVKAMGVPVTFIAVDCEVHTIKKVSSVAELIASVKGGGGTSFIPAFDAIEKLKPRPNVIIYATDGEGRAPAQPPKGIRVIWLLIGKNAPVPAPWGEIIRIDDD